MDKPIISVYNLPVYTVDGTFLGRVVGVEVDGSGRNVVSYQVATKLPIIKLWRQKLVISAQQVVSIGPQALVVESTKSRKPAAALSEQRPGLAAEPT